MPVSEKHIEIEDDTKKIASRFKRQSFLFSKQEGIDNNINLMYEKVLKKDYVDLR